MNAFKKRSLLAVLAVCALGQSTQLNAILHIVGAALTGNSYDGRPLHSSYNRKNEDYLDQLSWEGDLVQLKAVAKQAKSIALGVGASILAGSVAIYVTTKLLGGKIILTN